MPEESLWKLGNSCKRESKLVYGLAYLEDPVCQPGSDWALHAENAAAHIYI